MTSPVNEEVGVGVGMAGGAIASVPAGAGAEASLPQSPAPPAISPLTEPTDPGNREPSINPINLDSESNDPNHVPDASASAILPSATAQLYVDTLSQLKAEPLDSDGTIPQHLQYPIQMMDLDTNPNQNPMANIYGQQAGTTLLARLTQFAAASNLQQFALPPSTVHPAQVSLPQSLLDAATDATMQQTAVNPVNMPTAVESPLESFAKIEFADSTFQMTTYAVIIGRDNAAMRQSARDEKREKAYQERVAEARRKGEPEPEPPKRNLGKFSKSYVSNEGGMLGPESDSDDKDEARPAKRRKMNDASSSDRQQRQISDPDVAGENLIVNRQYVSHTPGAAAVNLDALRPSPNHVPFIGIHSPGPNISSRTKAISRKHLKIEFNKETGVFEAFPLHRNGFFCDEIHYRDDKVVLKSGSVLQIKDVDFTFTINGVPKGCTGAEQWQNDGFAPNRRYSEGGKEMSFDFESTHDVERRSTSVEEDEQAEQAAEDSQSELSDVAMEDVEQEDENGNEVMETIENDGDENTQHRALQDQNHAQPGTEAGGTPGLQMPPKKRGPGRPPKNGVMSKREERLQKKAAMELAKKNAPPPPPGEPPIKRKVGRPRKHPLPEEGGERPEKRKYKPRKSKNGEEGEGSDGERAVKEKRREKPKTPPLELRREDYTDEQLQKPPKNYGVLIDEVLSAAPDGLTLKQIYKRIQQKYPFYYFLVDTKGWESSVRHNLIGNDAFKKNDQTHLWSRVPGIDIDAGKKRKATSPENPSTLHNYNHQQYQASMNPHAGAYQTNHAAHQGYQARPTQQPTSANHGQIGAGANPQQTQQYARPPMQTGTPVQQQLPRPAYPSQAPPGQKPAVGVSGGLSTGVPRPLQATGAQNPTYSSPYVSKPTSHVAQPGATPHSMARQLSQPSNGVNLPHGLPAVGNSTGATVAHNGTSTPQSVVSGANMAAVDPPISPELLKLVNSFKALVEDQLKQRSKAPLLVAMSAIFRGLGLSSMSIFPEEEAMENIILKVFETSRKNTAIHPNLLQGLLKLKEQMIGVLQAKLGAAKAECLFLSAAGRTLGFIDRSIMQGNEATRQEYEKAENVLKVPLDKAVLDHQAWKAATRVVGTQSPAPAATAPPMLTPSAPARVPVSGPVNAPTQAPQASVQPRAPQAPMQAQVAQPAPQARAPPAPMQVQGTAVGQAAPPTRVPQAPMHAQVSQAALQARAPVPAPTVVGPAPAPGQTPVSAGMPLPGQVPAATQAPAASGAPVITRPVTTQHPVTSQPPVAAQTPLQGTVQTAAAPVQSSPSGPTTLSSTTSSAPTYTANYTSASLGHAPPPRPTYTTPATPATPATSATSAAPSGVVPVAPTSVVNPTSRDINPTSSVAQSAVVAPGTKSNIGTPTAMAPVPAGGPSPVTAHPTIAPPPNHNTTLIPPVASSVAPATNAPLSPMMVPTAATLDSAKAFTPPAAPVGNSTPASLPAVSQAPVVTQAPAVTQTTTVTQAPVATQAPAVNQIPTVPQASTVVQPQVVAQPPAVTQAPTVSQSPAVTQAPAAASPAVVSAPPLVSVPAVASPAGVSGLEKLSPAKSVTPAPPISSSDLPLTDKPMAPTPPATSQASPEVTPSLQTKPNIGPLAGVPTPATSTSVSASTTTPSILSAPSNINTLSSAPAATATVPSNSAPAVAPASDRPAQ